MDSDLITSDEALVQQFQRGDPTAFDKLYLKYEGQLYYKILKIVGNPQDAQDIRQETFFKVYQQLSTLCLKNSFTAWLSTVARNCCIDHLRKVRKEQVLMSIDDLTIVIYDWDPSPQEKLIADEWFREALQQLKPRLRAILLLDAKGHTFKQIALELNLNVNSVPTLLSKARKTFHRLLSSSVRRGKCSG